jgi:hypothetical protein
MIGEVLKGALPELTLPAGFSIPSGAAKIGIFAKDINASISANSVTIPLIDNTSLLEVSNAVKTNYYPNIPKFGIEQVVRLLNDQAGFITYSKDDIKLFLSLIDSLCKRKSDYILF